MVVEDLSQDIENSTADDTVEFFSRGSLALISFEPEDDDSARSAMIELDKHFEDYAILHFEEEFGRIWLVLRSDN